MNNKKYWIFWIILFLLVSAYSQESKIRFPVTISKINIERYDSLGLSGGFPEILHIEPYGNADFWAVSKSSEIFKIGTEKGSSKLYCDLTPIQTGFVHTADGNWLMACEEPFLLMIEQDGSYCEATEIRTGMRIKILSISPQKDYIAAADEQGNVQILSGKFPYAPIESFKNKSPIWDIIFLDGSTIFWAGLDGQYYKKTIGLDNIEKIDLDMPSFHCFDVCHATNELAITDGKNLLFYNFLNEKQRKISGEMNFAKIHYTSKGDKLIVGGMLEDSVKLVPTGIVALDSAVIPMAKIDTGKYFVGSPNGLIASFFLQDTMATLSLLDTQASPAKVTASASSKNGLLTTANTQNTIILYSTDSLSLKYVDSIGNYNKLNGLERNYIIHSMEIADMYDRIYYSDFYKFAYWTYEPKFPKQVLPIIIGASFKSIQHSAETPFMLALRAGFEESKINTKIFYDSQFPNGVTNKKIKNEISVYQKRLIAAEDAENVQTVVDILDDGTSVIKYKKKGAYLLFNVYSNKSRYFEIGENERILSINSHICLVQDEKNDVHYYLIENQQKYFLFNANSTAIDAVITDNQNIIIGYDQGKVSVFNCLTKKRSDYDFDEFGEIFKIHNIGNNKIAIIFNSKSAIDANINTIPKDTTPKPNGYATSIAVSPTDPDIFFVGYSDGTVKTMEIRQ